MRTTATTTTATATTATTATATTATTTHHHQDLSVIFTPIISEAIGLHSELIPYYSNLKVPRSLVEKVQSLIKKLPARSADSALQNNNNNNIDSYVIQPLEFIYISHIYSILNLTKISEESLSILTESFIQDMSVDSKNNTMNYFTVSCFISGKHIYLSS
jgi:hypothetical protein